MKNAKVEEIRNNLTAQVLRSLEEGNPCWRKPWNLGPNSGNPAAASTGKTYRGGNNMILCLVADASGFDSRWWNTFENWRKFKVFPRKGSHGTWCQFAERKRVPARPDVYDADADGSEKHKDIFIYKAFVVFNAEQCDGPPDVMARFLCQENPDISNISYECVDELIARNGIKVKTGGDAAYYSPTLNYIQMPKKGFFKGAGEYYATLLHEAIHWAQSQKAGRDARKSRMGTDEYAEHELTAELGSVFLMRELGLPYADADQIASHSGYLKGWMHKIKESNQYIFKVSTEAGKLVDILTGRQEESREQAREMATA